MSDGCLPVPPARPAASGSDARPTGWRRRARNALAAGLNAPDLYWAFAALLGRPAALKRLDVAIQTVAREVAARLQETPVFADELAQFARRRSDAFDG